LRNLKNKKKTTEKQTWGAIPRNVVISFLSWEYAIGRGRSVEEREIRDPSTPHALKTREKNSELQMFPGSIWS
jgi:hypothetical protein